MDTLVNIFHVNFLGYSYLFMPIIIYQMKDDFISVYQYRYDTSIVANYLDTATVKTTTQYYKTTLPYDIIVTKSGASTSDEQVGNLTR